MIKSDPDYALGHSTYTITCDDCGDEIEIVASEWSEMIEELKSERWRITKEDGEWTHYCSDCKDPFLMPRAGFRYTHCRLGHPFSEANTYIRPDNGRRQCRRCRTLRQRAYRLRHGRPKGDAHGK